MSEDEPKAEEMAEIVRREFAGDDRPATVEMVSRVYSTMFAQNEAMVAMFELVMKRRPDLLFTDEVVDLQKQLRLSLRMLTSDLKEMHHGKESQDG